MPQVPCQRLRFAISRIIILSVIGLSAACGAPAPSLPTATMLPPQPAKPTETPAQVTLTATPVPPTSTATSTQTPTQTPTLLPSSTPTELPPELSITQNAVCFTGQGTTFPLAATLVAGDTAVIIGSDAAQNWWWIQLVDGTDCWISALAGDVQGNAVLLPVLTAAPTPVILPSSTPDVKSLKFLLVAVGTGGPFGCGDGLVYFYSGANRTDRTEDNVKAALNALFDVKSEYLGDYYNPVYKSNLNVSNVTLDRSSGHALVYLTGTFIKPKDECDSKRIHAQVWETIYQFEEIKRVDIWVKDKLLGDLLEMAP